MNFNFCDVWNDKALIYCFILLKYVTSGLFIFPYLMDSQKDIELLSDDCRSRYTKYTRGSNYCSCIIIDGIEILIVDQNTFVVPDNGLQERVIDLQ